MEDWLSFKDTFITMVHRQDDITNVQKLQYLKSALKDDALRKIQVFAITDENYTRAWDLLLKSYENRKILISRHLSLLVRLPVQEKETSQGLIVLADESQQHIQSLASLGISISPELVVAIIEDKLHKNTLEKWDETLTRDDFPEFNDLIEFLYRTAARISKRKPDQVSSSDASKGPTPPKQRKAEFKRQAFITTPKKCPICDSPHLLFQCDEFLKLNIQDRIKTVKNAALCNNCLRGHKGNECKFGNCKKCGKRHNTLLHIEKGQCSDKNNTKEL